MKTFGIRMSEPNYPHNHSVAADNISDDSVLFDWLTADNFIPSDDFTYFKVVAPEGYLFLEEDLVPISTLTAEQIQSVGDEDNDVWSYIDVSRAYPNIEKANTLIEVVMKDVSPKEFYALNIPEERVLTFTVD